MQTNKYTILILAAGLGSRYNGLKQVDGLTDNGTSLLEFSIYDAIYVGFNKIVVVVNNQVSDLFKNKLTKFAEHHQVEIHFVTQTLETFLPNQYKHLLAERTKPWGTSHAVYVAKDIIHEPFLVLNADDYYGHNSYKIVIEAMQQQRITPTQYAMVAYPINKTLSEHGSVSRGICYVNSLDLLENIVEYTNIVKAENSIQANTEHNAIELSENAVVSMNFWAFHPSVFLHLAAEFEQFLSQKPTAKQEFFIPIIIQHLIEMKKAEVQVFTATDQWFGMTYSNDKPIVQSFINIAKKQGLYPENM